MGLVELFIASTIPVLKVLLITALGSWLALDNVNILGNEARKHVNNVVFYVFNPALVYSSLAQTITNDMVVKLWFMPINILFTFVLGSVLGWLIILIARPPSNLRGLIVACCAAGNLGNMFLIMIPAVCKEKGSPFGSPDVCQSLGLAYISLSLAVGAIYFWSYVFNIVKVSSSTRTTGESRNLYNGKSTIKTSASNLENLEESLLTSKDAEPPEDATPPPSNLTHKIWLLLENTNWKSLFTPSTVGAVVGFTVALIPGIRNMLIGDQAPLRVIHDSALLLGQAAVPTITLIVGGNLTKGLQGSRTQKPVVIGILAARYIALPLSGIAIVKGALRLGFVPADPLYQFILLLQFAVPPAMNIGTITQLFGMGETECSVIMLWAYSLASISLTLWSTFFLWLVS